MLESLLTISITGFIAGFIFAMPIAGPISILVVSNALNGKRKYSNQICLGAAFSDFIYIFIAVYGVTSLYSYYNHLIPYLLIAGALFFIILGVKLFRKPVDIENFEKKKHLTEKIKDSDTHGVYTGFMVNMLNPTQFLAGFISSFFVISLLASMGLNTGGLEAKINNNVKEISSINGKSLEEKIPEKIRKIENDAARQDADPSYPAGFYLAISIFYSLFLSLGGLVWFFLLAWILAKYRMLINIKILTSLIKGFGVSLCLIGLYFGYLGVEEFI